MTDKIINLNDYSFSNISYEEDEKEYIDDLTIDDILGASTESPSLSEMATGLFTIHSMVEELMKVDTNQFLNELMFTYVNMKTNASIKEKAKKFKINENLLFAAYYKIFLKSLKKNGRGYLYEAYKEVYTRTGIGESVIKSISGAKSNHMKHAKKVIDEIRRKFGILK
jgi:hypothetical protein